MFQSKDLKEATNLLIKAECIPKVALCYAELMHRVHIENCRCLKVDPCKQREKKSLADLAQCPDQCSKITNTEPYLNVEKLYQQKILIKDYLYSSVSRVHLHPHPVIQYTCLFVTNQSSI